MVRVANFPEPTPEFNQKCIEVINQFSTGDLPYENALAELEKLALEADKSSNLVNQGRVEQLMGYIQHYRGNLDISIRHNEKARSLFSRAGNPKRVATIDLNQGENYRFKGELNRAAKLYQSAYEVAEQFGDLRLQTIASSNEGLVLLTLKKYDEAHISFNKSLKLAQQLNVQEVDIANILCEIYHGLAVIHLHEGNLEAAWMRALEALQVAEEAQQPLIKGYANRTLGEVITELKTSPDARFSSDPDDYFRASIGYLQELKADAEMARTMFAQSLSLAKRGRRTMAAKKLQQVMDMFSKLGMVDDAARAAEAQLALM
ncbi:MAG: tetratricopeptide repeat protein [Phototrophicales bacterium]|nr:tetratricopeptide repeat protein [Phototrophicales bacterium]